MRFEKSVTDSQGRQMWRAHLPGHGELLAYQSGLAGTASWRFCDPITGTSQSFDNVEDMTDFVRQHVAKLREQETDPVRRAVVEALAIATAAVRTVREAA